MMVTWRDPGTPVTPDQLHVRWLVYEQITDLPSTFSMSDWERRHSLDPCSTTRCIGGWAQFFARGRVDIGTVQQDAVDAMGLSRGEYYAGGVALFFATEADAVAKMKTLAGA